MDGMRGSGFHIGHDWYVKRGSDGSVTFFVSGDGGREITLSAGQWASVVAGVSQYGEGDRSYHSALNFHGTDAPAN